MQVGVSLTPSSILIYLKSKLSFEFSSVVLMRQMLSSAPAESSKGDNG